MDPVEENKILKKELKIAKAGFGYLLEQRGFTLCDNSKRDLQNIAKKLNLSFEEVQDFVRPFVQQMIDKTLGKPKAARVGFQ